MNNNLLDSIKNNCLVIDIETSSHYPDGTVVSIGNLPDKLNPVVRSIMNSLKYEENPELQNRSASSLATLVYLCSKREKSPNDKIVKNVFISPFLSLNLVYFKFYFAFINRC